MIDAAASVRRARAAIGTEYRQNGCLEAVYGWCGTPATGLPSGLFKTAIAAFRRTVGQVRTDWRNAPPGAVHYWDGNPGHVALGTGNGHAITTNAPQKVSSVRNGVKLALVGERTIPEIGKGRGRYLGWALDAFNNPISTAAPAGSSAQPIQEDDMPNYREWDRDDKTSLRNDIIGTGLFGDIPDGDGTKLSPLQLMVEASQRSERAANAAEEALERVLSMHTNNFKPVGGKSKNGTLAFFDEKLAATSVAITTAILAALQDGREFDPEELTEAVREGVRGALDSIETTVTLRKDS